MTLKSYLTGEAMLTDQAMKEPTFKEAFEMLCRHAGENGREEVLFGDSLPRVKEYVPPYLTGMMFPETYFEFPLSGNPFLDAVVSYGRMIPGMKTEAGDEAGEILEWVANTQKTHRDIAVGFELDTHCKEFTTPAIHFQPRRSTETVRPFCELIGENESAKLYLDMCDRMQNTWPLSLFGLFRGRSNSPLRISGYLTKEAKEAYSFNPKAIAGVFDTIGFKAYSSEMLSQVSEIIGIAPDSLDFQFDVYPDYTIGDKFSLDVHIKERQTDAILNALSNDPLSEIINMWKDLGILDERIELVKECTMKQSFPIIKNNGSLGEYILEYRPKWIKISWKDARPVISKCYCLIWGGVAWKNPLKK